jgi:hypothetical protein
MKKPGFISPGFVFFGKIGKLLNIGSKILLNGLLCAFFGGFSLMAFRNN